VGAKLVVDVDGQNGAPDGVALIDTGNGTLLDALSYEGAILAATIGGRLRPRRGTVLPWTSPTRTRRRQPRRIPDGRDANDAASDWAFTTTATPGAANVKTP
jgi:hypothetical protein